MSSSEPDELSGSSALGKPAPFWVLCGVGGALSGALLFDAYLDWIVHGDVLWSTALEYSLPTLLALTLPYIGWRLLQNTTAPIYLSEAARGTLFGSVGAIVLSSLLMGPHVLQEEIRAVAVIFQMTAVGAIAGLWVGYTLARVKEAEREAQDDRDRLANLLDGLPVPVVHGRVQGDRLSILQANVAFEEVFGRESEEVVGQDLNEIVVPEERRGQAPDLDRQAIEQGLVETEVKCLTSDGPRDFLLRIAQALDDGAAETYSVYTDITEQKKRESALEQMREQMELALKHTGSLLFGINLETESIWRRGPFEKFFGMEAEEVSTMEPFFDRAIHPEDRERLRLFYQRLAEGEEESGEVEYRTNPERGPCRWIRDSINVDNAGSRKLLGLAQDITEQKDRQEELRRKERRYQAVFEDPNILVGLLTTDGRVLDINKTAMAHVSPTLDEIVGEPFWETPWFDGDERVQEQVQAWVDRASSGEYVEFEVDLSRSVGKPLIVRGVVRPVTDEEGEVTSLLITDRDITLQKEQEQQLRRKKSLLEQTQRLAGAWEVDLLSGEMSWSEKIYEIHKVDPGTDVSVEEGIEFYAPEVQSKVREAYEKCTQDGEPYDLEVPIITADGNRRWVRTVGAPTEKRDGEIVRVAGAFQDITTRKERTQELQRAKQQAEEAEKLFETIFENVPVMIEIIDFNTGYRRVNDHLEDVIGWTTKELEKHPNTTELFYRSPEEQKRVRELVKTAPEGWHEIQPQAKSGEILDTLWTFAKLPNDRRLAIGLDISQRKKRERALKRAKEEAEEANRLKTAMLANMSHELRTPLTSISGFSEMLKKNLNGEHKLFATKIHKSSRRLQQTLESVLRLSTLEAGVEELEQEELYLGTVVEDVVKTLEVDAKEKSLAVTTELPDSQVSGYWNEDATHRICRNLLDNAIKFSPDGGQVEVRVSSDEQNVILEIEDTGIGMDPENVPDLFTPFKQESEGLDREYEGTGLGLSIVERLVEELNGTIDVETEKGVGTCFTVRLPPNRPAGSDHRGRQ